MSVLLAAPAVPLDRSAPLPEQVPPNPRILDARELLAGAGEVLIRLDDSLYRLRLTRNHRLILTK